MSKRYDLIITGLTPELHEKVQPLLFKIGYRWLFGVSKLKHTHSVGLYLQTNPVAEKRLTYSDDPPTAIDKSNAAAVVTAQEFVDKVGG